jgi:hypothetical protein
VRDVDAHAATRSKAHAKHLAVRFGLWNEGEAGPSATGSLEIMFDESPAPKA